MMTVVTYATLRQGAEPEWDEAMRNRLASARSHPGWVGGQLLIPLDGPNRRVIVGTWRTRADWEAWHNDEAFQQARERLEGLESDASDTTWFEVLADVRPGDGSALQ
jgi:heme-degrading monooxygenase HmoA